MVSCSFECSDMHQLEQLKLNLTLMTNNGSHIGSFIRYSHFSSSPSPNSSNGKDDLKHNVSSKFSLAEQCCVNHQVTDMVIHEADLDLLACDPIL